MRPFLPLICRAISFVFALAGAAAPLAAYEVASDPLHTLSLDRLPREVSNTLEAWKPSCGDRLAAGQMFARVSEIGGQRYLTLHFEELACVDRSAICNATGCRHEVFALVQGRFHRVFTRHTQGLDLRELQNAAVLELDCGLLGCLRALRWNGRTFLETSATGPDSEHIFGFTEGADVGLKGDKELENTFTGRFGKPGRYSAIEGETALRYLWADGLRTSLTMLSDAHEIRHVPGLQDASTVAFNGLGGEFRWQALTREAAPVALAFSFEPQWRRIDDLSGQRQDSWALPVIALVDVAIVPGRVFAAMNVGYTPAFAHIDAGWQQQSALEISAALSAALRPDIFIGAEVRHVSAYQGALLACALGDATFVGPSLFIALPAQTTLKLAWSAQVAGHATASPGDRLNLAEFERHQARLQVVKAF
jgi:hypothetical protein